MKLNKLYIILVIAAGFAGVTSCKKSAFDINRNPNSPTDSTITYNLLLASSLQTTASLVETQWGFLQNWLGFWARSGTYAPSVTEETYDVTNNFQTGVWDNFYANTFNYDIMQQKAVQAGAPFYESIARIMKAHNFQILVDVYNNIPYTAALQGTKNPTPEYTSGEDVYKDLFRQLDTAITLLKSVNIDDPNELNADITTNDLLFGGDVDMWIKFANTLKLRMLVHVADVPGFDFAGEVAKINATGVGYLGTGETAELNPGFNSSKPNPFYLSYVADEAQVATANSVYYKANVYAASDGTGSTEPGLAGYYRWNSDPRVSRFYTAGNQGMRGVTYGLPPVTTNAAATLSAISGPGIMKNHGYDAPAWIFTSVESLFLQAEAAHRHIIAGDAATLTNAAITESFVWLGLTADDAAAYIANNAGFGDVDYSAGGLTTIISQKWFALNAIATFEVWTDYRRVPYGGADHFVYGAVSGYADGPPISVAPQNTRTEIPIRLLYPQSEHNYNAANVKAEGTPDAFTSPVFWDVK